MDALQRVLASTDWKINWEGKPLLKIEGLHMDEHYLRMRTQPKQHKFCYNGWRSIRENYERWQQCWNLAERSTLLENILAWAQILGFCTAMGYRFRNA